MISPRCVGLFGLLVLLSACGGGSSRKGNADSIGNACQENEECGEDGHCVLGFCEAKDSGLKQVLIEVTPPVGVASGEYAQVRYLSTVMLEQGGALDIGLDVVAELAVAALAPSSNCQPIGLDESGFLPIKVKVFDASGINGITASPISGESDPAKRDSAQGNLVTLPMAPGAVDLYIEPVSEDVVPDAQIDPTGECDLAPILVLGLPISAGHVQLAQRLSVAEHVTLDVVLPDGTGLNAFLDGWTIDLVEPIGGRRLSNRVPLAQSSVEPDGTTHYGVRLAYHPIIGADAERMAGAELVRLSPPAGLLAPTYYAARSGLDLFDTGDLVLAPVRDVPAAVVVDGLVESEFDGTPIPADIVAILATEETPSTGVLASFRATTSTDDRGHFELNLIAGKYKIVAIPTDGSRYATQSLVWTVASSPAFQAGRLIQVGAIGTLTGIVQSAASHVALAESILMAQPSSIGRRPTFLDEILGHGRPIGQRSQMAVADSTGRFELPVDEGRYDIAVRPVEGTGYPWAIRPSVAVDTEANGLSVLVRNPVAYSGTVTVPDRAGASARMPLPGALLRFFALFDEKGQLADGGLAPISAVEVGQTRTAADGKYRLLLPDRLD